MRTIIMLAIVFVVGCNAPDAFELAADGQTDDVRGIGGDAAGADAMSDAFVVDASEVADVSDASMPDTSVDVVSDAAVAPDAFVTDASDAMTPDAAVDAGVDVVSDAAVALDAFVADAPEVSDVSDASTPDRSVDVDVVSDAAVASDAFAADASETSMTSDASAPDTTITPSSRCAMLTTCDACLASPSVAGWGCGWCDGSRRCFYGTESSPETAGCAGWRGPGAVCR